MEPRIQTSLMLLFSILFLGLLDNQMVSPLLAILAESLHASVPDVGNSVTLYSLSAACCALLVGPLSDRRGRARFLKLATFAFGASSLLATASNTLASFFTARILAGMAAGVISAGTISYAADLVPYSRRGRAMGIISASYFAAPIIGVPLGSWLADGAGWRSVYLILACLAFALWLLMRRSLPEISPPARASSDAPRSYAKAYLSFLAQKAALAGAASSFFVSAGIAAFITYLGAHLTSRFNVSVRAVGTVFLIAGAASLVGSLISGWLSDSLGKKPVIIASHILLAAALIFASQVAWGSNLFAALIAGGLAASLRIGPLHALVTEIVSARSRGAYVALRNSFSQLGIAISVLASGRLYDAMGFTAVAYFSATMNVAAALLVTLIREPVGQNASD